MASAIFVGLTFIALAINFDVFNDNPSLIILFVVVGIWCIVDDGSKRREE